MGELWKVIIIDRMDGGERFQDVTDWVDMMQSDFHPTVSDKVGQCQARMSFPIDTPDLRIRELMEVWAGFIDEGTGQWTTPWFGGYIIGLTSTTNGGEHTLDLDLVDYGILLSNTEVLRWPRDRTDPAADGYPVGFSMANWLVGTTPFIGLIPAFFQGVAWDVDSIFDSVIFTNQALPGILNPEVLPGNATIYGQWYYTTVRKILEDLCDQAHYIDPTIEPAFWIEAATDGTVILPRVRVADLAVAHGTPAYVFSSNPLPGELLMEHPFKHSRDARLVRTRVTTKGDGWDTSGIPDGVDPLDYVIAHLTDGTMQENFWSEYNSAHAGTAPTTYQIAPGWSGAPIQDERLNTVGKCRGIAEHLEQIVWGARGRVEFRTNQFILPGTFIQIKDPVEFGDTNPVYPVVEVQFERNAGRALFTLICGKTPPGIEDILKGGTVDIPILEHDTGRAAARAAGRAAIMGGGAYNTGLPRGATQAIVSTPTHAQHNQIVPWTYGQQALNIQQQPQTQVETGETWTPKPLVTIRDKYGNVSQKADHLGHGHPLTLHLSFDADGKYKFSNYYDVTFIEERIEDPVFNAGVTITYTLNAVVQPTPTGATPLVYHAGDTLLIETAGIDSTEGMWLEVSEYAMPVVP